MPKVPIYIRLAKSPKGYRVDASSKPNQKPIMNDYQYKPLPTVSFGLSINIPEEAFEDAVKVIAEIDYRSSEVTVADDTKDIEVKINKMALSKLRG